MVESYRKIIDSLELLHQKSKETKIMIRSVGKCWGFLEDFLRTKNTKELDSKEKAIWFLEIETKLGCCLEFLLEFKYEEDITNSPKDRFP